MSIDNVFKMLKKESKNASIGSEGLLSDTKWWFDTGSYIFNALLSGSFFKGIPGNKIVGFAGELSSGKTLLTFYILKSFLDENENNRIIYFDSEGTITTDLLMEMNFDLNRFIHVVVDSSNMFKNILYKVINAIENEKSDTKYFLILDSLGNLELKMDKENTLKDKDTADMGKRAAYNKTIFRTITPQLSILQIPMIVTSHTYDSMSQYAQKGISGGTGLGYAANIIIEFIPKRIKNEDNIVGINVLARARKSRSTIQWKQVNLGIYYKGGLDRYYGLIDFALEVGYFKKSGNKIKINNEEVYFRKEINDNIKEIFTNEVLKELDVYAHDYFCYGNGSVEVEETEADNPNE